MERKTEVQESVNKDFKFFQAIFAPRQSGVHGTCHARHT